MQRHDIKTKLISLSLATLVAASPMASLTTFASQPAKKEAQAKKQTSANKKATGTTRRSSRKGASPSSAKKASPASKNTSAKKNAPSSKGATKKSGRKAAPKESSADIKRQQRVTQQEIAQTQEQIRENDRSIKQNLVELGRIKGDMETTQRQINLTESQVGALNNKIGGLQKQISDNEAKLQRMRAEYLKAVKKMRTARKNNSALAFIFASESFNQALRRMRYLRQFSQWKERQSAAITQTTTQLKKQTDQLGRAKSEKDVALRRQRDARKQLEQQHNAQDAIVVELRNNGKALNDHLARKKAQASQLEARIAAAIAEEQRKAAEEARLAEERRQKAAEVERQRQAEIERQRQAEQAVRQKELLAQQQAQAKAEADQKAADAAAAANDEAARQRAEEKAARATSTRSQRQLEKKRQQEEKKRQQEEKKRLEREAKERRNEEKRLQEQQKRKEKNDKKQNAGSQIPSKTINESYADARRKAPRGTAASGNSAATASKAPAAATASLGNFGSMKGKLPRPASGSFKVIKKFGRQPLPDLPGVMEDNSGIDAEVSAGSAALAVYGGRVASVYRLAGYGEVVMLNHGDYFTIYCNLASANVKKGDMVKMGQSLGTIAPDEDDPSTHIIHFEVWKNRSKLNPLEWIR